MAEKKVIEVEIQDNTKSLKSQYKDAVTELQKLSATYGETSMEAIKAAKAAAELKDRIEDTNDLIKTQKGEGAFIAVGKSIQAASSGLAAYEGALGLIGVESEELQKTMLRVQSAMALAQGLEGLEDAGRAFKTLGATIKSTTLFTTAYNFVMGISNKETATNVLVTEADTTAKVGLTGATGVLSTVTGGATTAMKLFRVALIATGIGAIVVLIGLLIANFDKVTAVVQKLSGYVIKAYDYFDNLGTVIKVLVGIFFPFIGIVYGAIKALEYFNIIDTKNERDMSARHVANIKRIDKELAKREEAKKARKKAYDEETANIDRQIKLLEAQGKSTEALEKLQLKRSLTNQRELIKEARLNLQILRATNIGGVNDEMIEETVKAIAEMKQAILNTENDIKIARINNAKEVKEKIQETDKEIDLTKDELYQLEQKRLAELNKAELDSLNVIDAAKKANADMLLTEQELAIQKENEAYQIKLDNAIKFGQDTEALEIEHLNNLNNINLTAQEKQYANDKEAKEKQIALDKETAEKKLEIEKILNEQKATIQQQGLDVALQGIGVIKSVFEKSKGVQKAAVIAESAIGIAKMIISTKTGNAAARAAGLALSIPSGGASVVAAETQIALNNISTGLGIAANVAATAKALSALGGGGAPSGSLGGDGGGGGGGGFNPSFNVVGNSGINQLAGIQQQPVKAYITTGEVSTALSLERNTLQKTTF
jgi:hypothetical protein